MDSWSERCMYVVFCVLCAVKLDDKASRINVRGRFSFRSFSFSRLFSLSVQAERRKSP